MSLTCKGAQPGRSVDPLPCPPPPSASPHLPAFCSSPTVPNPPCLIAAHTGPRTYSASRRTSAHPRRSPFGADWGVRPPLSLLLLELSLGRIFIYRWPLECPPVPQFSRVFWKEPSMLRCCHFDGLPGGEVATHACLGSCLPLGTLLGPACCLPPPREGDTVP